MKFLTDFKCSIARKSSVLILLLLVMTNVGAQHIPKLSKFQSLDSEIYPIKHPDILIVADTLRYSTTGCIIHDALLHNSPALHRLKFDNCTFFSDFSLEVDSTYFTKNGTLPSIGNCKGNDISIEMQAGFTITNCFFEDILPVRHVIYNSSAGAANINNNITRNVDVSDCSLRLLNVMNNKVKDQVSVSYSKSILSIIARNKFEAKNGVLNISYSRFQVGCELIENDNNYISLKEDSLFGILQINESHRMINNASGGHKVVEFRNCYINSSCFFILPDSIGSSKITFDNCSFGSSASMFSVVADTLVFLNCTNIPSPLFLTADSSKKQVHVCFINSNVTNIRFDYTEHFKLFFLDASDETKNSTYQSLLAKYKAEGKPENIKRIDIEYKEFDYKKHWYSYPQMIIDFLWWNYGYSKWLIIVWSVLLIFIFVGYNYNNWESMRTSYAVFDKDELQKNDEKVVNIAQKFVHVFIFTSFIFFALRIDFDKLNYKSNKYVVIFFIQYVVGLICLFFLANAIFKLG